MRTLPTVNSGVQITRVEVWVTNVRQDFQQNRNVVAFTDLGEDASAAAIAANQLSGDLPPGLVLDGTVNVASNAANTLYQRVSNDPGIRGFFQATGALQVLGLRDARHFERLENARLLLQNEYTINDRLGFISLNQSLNNDEVLAVAYQYTFQGETYQVGEFSTDGIGPPSALVLRLLKATITDPKLPLWDLMMKNIYSLGAFQVNRDNFRLDLIYNNPTTGVDINYIPRAPLDQIPLIQALGLDRLDPNNAPNPDGWFDFIDGAATVGGTIQSQSGRIFFPVLEPFGEFLDRQLVGPDPNAPLNPPQLRRTITYQQLYDSTKTAAQNQPEFNRFRLKGSYRSASSDVISLNSVNIPQGQCGGHGRWCPIDREPGLYRRLQPGSRAYPEPGHSGERHSGGHRLGEQLPVQHPDKDLGRRALRLQDQQGPGIRWYHHEPVRAPIDPEGERG
jgi:cell surface protein SprA